MVGDEPDVAALAAVAAVRPAEGDRTLPAERHAARAAVTAAHVELALVDELGHHVNATGGPSPRSVAGCRARFVAAAPPAATLRSTPRPYRRGMSDPTMQERADRWASTMRGHAAGDVRLAHADSRAARRHRCRRRDAPRGASRPIVLRRCATRASAPGDRARAGGARPVADVLRARPRPHPARHRVPPAGRQDAGVRVPRRPPAHPAHPRARGRPGRDVVARALGLNVALTEAIALGHDCGHGPGGHASEDALSPYVDGRLRPRRVGRRRHARAAEPLRRDARRHPQPLVEPPGAGDAGGRGRVVGRPHRLRVPRLRGRGRRRHRRRRHAPGARRRPLRATRSRAARRVHRGDDRRRRRTGRSA